MFNVVGGDERNYYTSSKIAKYAGNIKMYCRNCIDEDTTSLWQNVYCKKITSAANAWSLYTNITGYTNWVAPLPSPPLPLSERFRQILQARQAPMILLSSRTPVKTAPEVRELRARETLRRMLGDDKFQRFLRNGFVSAQGKSGKVYQIYPGHGMTIVYDRGTPVERLCMVLQGDFAATDSLITRYVMILHDEQRFRVLAKVWQATPRLAKMWPLADTRALPEIFHSLKVAA